MCQKVICQIFWWVKSNFCRLESKSESFSVGLESESDPTKFFQQLVSVQVLQKSPSPFNEFKFKLEPLLLFQVLLGHFILKLKIEIIKHIEQNVYYAEVGVDPNMFSRQW